MKKQMGILAAIYSACLVTIFSLHGLQGIVIYVIASIAMFSGGLIAFLLLKLLRKFGF